MSASIEAIYITAAGGKPLHTVNSAQLLAKAGIEGDRYCSGKGKLSKRLEKKALDDWQITLIEAEEIDRFVSAEKLEHSYGDFRRNLVTRGVRLNDLVGKRFSVGDVQLEGVRLCEPCAYLAKLLTPKILPAMLGRGGLRARILNSGLIKPGDPIGLAED